MQGSWGRAGGGAGARQLNHHYQVGGGGAAEHGPPPTHTHAIRNVPSGAGYLAPRRGVKCAALPSLDICHMREQPRTHARTRAPVLVAAAHLELDGCVIDAGC